jgi:hypothetical protein
MVYIAKYIAFISMVDPTIAFTATSQPHSSSYQVGLINSFNSITPTHLNLHPDQASELEAAASELLKNQQAEKHDETEEKIIDDTNNHDSSTLSASSSLSQPTRKWWSTSFSSFVRRHSR